MAPLLASLFVGLCGLLLYYIFRVRRAKEPAEARGCRPPRQYRHKDPFFGLDIFLRTGKVFSEHRYLPDLWQRYSEYGHTFQNQAFGTSTINSVESENLKTVFATSANDWGVQPLRLHNMEPFCGRGFITSDGPIWEYSRSLMKASFHRSNISNLSTLESCLQNMVKRVPRDGRTFDLQALLLDLAVNVLTGTTPAHAKDFLKAFDEGFSGSGLRIALGPFNALLSNRKWIKACGKTHAFADHYVDKAIQYRKELLSGHNNDSKAQREPHRIMLCNMAEQTEDKAVLRDQILQAMMAAQETTANLISNVFFLLARHSDVWHRLRQDILAFEGKELQLDDLSKLKYLHNVLSETHRIYPIFPQMNRIALRDTILPVGGGPTGQSPIFCPSGTKFDTSSYVLHRLSSIWGQDAAMFRPERWDSFKPGRWEFIPFGGGDRACAGQQKATLEASYVIVRLLQEFGSIESRDERDWQGQVQLTAKNLNGCKISLSPA